MKEKILLGMSGGLDSTYSVVALREQGYEVIGAVLKMSDETDLSAAQTAARELDVPLHTVDCTERFREIVIGDFLHEYAAARTPNPCVICNRYVKIEMLCELARELGISRVATGHYADIGRSEDGRFYIRAAADVRKDQSYVLWRLTQEQLSMLAFPLSSREKREVRDLASELSLPNADAKESQEICFIADDDYVAYVENALGKFPEGDFVDGDGKIVGRHRGIIHYTIGQRKGLGLSMGRPVFVSAIDPEQGTVTVSDEEKIFTTRLVCDTLNFQRLGPMRSGSIRAAGKIRYGARAISATVCFDGDRAEVFFDTPVRAVTPGQSAVFYDGEGVLFGGIICRN